MELSESERKCFELLVKWYKEKPGVVVGNTKLGVVVGYTKLMEELRANVETCKALIGKMKEIKVVTHDYPPGWLVSEKGAYFRISPSIDEVWQGFLQQGQSQYDERQYRHPLAQVAGANKFSPPYEDQHRSHGSHSLMYAVLSSC